MDLQDQVLSGIREYEEERATRRVFPSSDALEQLDTLPRTLPEEGLPPDQVIQFLIDIVAPATVLSTSGRYFGFVTGSSLPAASAANMLATAWDQNSALKIMSPAANALENIALSWIAELLRIPATATGTFVTGATMANFTGMSAARHHLLAARGYDVEANGLFHAPEFPVVVGEEAHSSLYKALMMLGLGRERVIKVPCDNQGRMDPTRFPELTEPSLVCLQAGNVNTGALDETELIALAKRSKSWVHIDGAFGLWAAHADYTDADSWATDGHKWLNVPYDSGIAFVRDAQSLTAAMTVTASYLNSNGGVEPMHKGPESSRRARGIDAWAALLSLGTSGVREMVANCCRHAQTFATELNENGINILNEVSLNQVLAALDTDEQTLKWIENVQTDGTCWVGSSIWKGRRVMRISVSSYATTDEDVERSILAMLHARPSQA